MKKVLLILLCLFMLGGCKKNESIDISKEFEDKVSKTKSYKLSGTMEIHNDEEVFSYAIDVFYLEDNYYKVEMTNSSNNHLQVILKNDDGLYVITPALNKSFKFESAWPGNSSQAYILESLVRDMKNTDNISTRNKDNEYEITTDVNYPNNPELKYQKIFLDKDYKISKVEVYNESDMLRIKVEISDLDYSAGLSKSNFVLSDYIKEEIKNENDSEKEPDKISSAIYPLYMPVNTYLSSSEIISSEDGDRAILTFSGDRNFVIVEENSVASLEHEIIPVYGDPLMVNDTIGAISSNSVYWTANDIDYYLVSNDLSMNEMVYVASSLGNYQSTATIK